MRKLFFSIFVASLLIVFWGNRAPAPAGEVDILIEKLVEKGVLSSSEAKEIVTEIQKESVKETEVVKKVAAETAKEVVKEEGKKGGFEIPKWVMAIKPFGDLRLRHDTQWKDNGTDEYRRNRERLRLRFGFKIKTSETTEIGVRFASGSGFQNTTNQSFDGHGRGKHIFIDRAYGTWKPTKHFTLTGGKHKNPLFTTPLVWDPDVNPEGVSEKLNFGVTDKVSIFANLGQWILEETHGNDSNNDATLLTYQIGTTVKFTKDIKCQLGITYYDFLNMEEYAYSSSRIGDDDKFIGFNHDHGQQMIFDSENKMVNKFGCWEIGAKFKAKKVLPVPFSIFGSFLKNADADTSDLIAKGANKTDSNPNDLLLYSGDDKDTGWIMGFDLGNKKKKGDWYAKYHYQVLEDYAFPAVFVDSDFHNGGTNNKGHYIHGRYLLTDNIQLRAAGFLTERDDERKDGKFDEDRIQLDVVLAF